MNWDKTFNLYRFSKSEHEKLLKKPIKSTYKQTSENIYKFIKKKGR